MGKRSVRENKNIYQLSRESRELTREAASEALVFLSPERIMNDMAERGWRVVSVTYWAYWWVHLLITFERDR